LIANDPKGFHKSSIVNTEEVKLGEGVPHNIIFCYYIMAKSSGGSNGGILGSGIFGFFGTTIECKAEDNSIYCNIMKFVNLFFALLLIGTILFYAFHFLYKLKKMKK